MAVPVGRVMTLPAQYPARRVVTVVLVQIHLILEDQVLPEINQEQA